MNWKRFDLVNNVLGWLVFAISAVVYLLTIEPTASLWDCAEFVACDYRLEVGHPPGAPFYMLIYNVMSQLAPTAAEAGLYANATSAIISAFTILFLFWTITHMLRRLVVPSFRLDSPVVRSGNEKLTLAESLVIFGGATVGALVCTFSDTFWYSAVEAEVYAFSSLFTAVVFWLMFKWEERSDEAGSDRWIVLMAYLMGLSIGVHLLNLLCMPAMALIYYYRKQENPTLKGAALAVLVSFGLIVVMMYGIVQGVPKMAGRFDYFFVNSLGTSFNTGLYFYLALILALIAWSVYDLHRAVRSGSAFTFRHKLSVFASIVLIGIPFLDDGYLIGIVLSIALAIALNYGGGRISVRFAHLVQVSLLSVMIGFSSYGVILVRAVADTPMNENAPSNAFSLRYYLSREQYGSAPLIYGPSFAARPTAIIQDKEVLGKAPKSSPSDPDKYTKLYDQPKREYASSDIMIFPRVYHHQYADSYNSWMGRAVGDYSQPTFAENLQYFFAYQLNYMYWRYFMWNFVGRQNDIPGHGGLMQGNAITGIPFIDEIFIGPQDNMPADLATNKGRNVYYALPLILGFLGMYYQVSRTQTRKRKADEKPQDSGTPIGHQSFWIVFMLFFMTGIAIVLYLNQTPGQPRERDYAYVGSFYAFTIWIAMGIPALWHLLQRANINNILAAGIAVFIGILIPIQMAGQNWDDHNRSGRTVARDFGINYLESCEPNAILFCYGDNDTFPLWYIQDVEGVRRDVRTANLSYLGGDWYIDQLRRKTYTGEPVPMKHMTPHYYYYQEAAYMGEGKALLPVSDAMKHTVAQAGSKEVIFPSDNLYLDVDSSFVASTIKDDPELARRVVSRMPISLAGKRYLDRGGLTVLDMLDANKWKRPIYWASTSPRNVFNNLENHQLLTGMAYQLLPVNLQEQKTVNAAGDTISIPEHSGVRIEQMYQNVMKKFRWGGASDPNVYMDEAARGMFVSLRNVVATLADALIEAGDNKRAQEVLRKCYTEISAGAVPYEYNSLRFINSLYSADMTKEADELIRSVAGDAMLGLDWIFRLDEDKLSRVMTDGSLGRYYQTALLSYQIAKSAGSKVLDVYEQKLLEYRRILER